MNPFEWITTSEKSLIVLKQSGFCITEKITRRFWFDFQSYRTKRVRGNSRRKGQE